MQCPLLVKAGICNLFMVPAIARLLFAKDTVASLTSTNSCWQMGCLFNVHPKDVTHIDESLCLQKTTMRVYSCVGIRTQARQLEGKCEYLYDILRAHDNFTSEFSQVLLITMRFNVTQPIRKCSTSGKSIKVLALMLYPTV